MALTQVLGVGTMVLIAHAAGRKDAADGNLVFNQSLALSAIAAVIVFVGGYAFGDAYLRTLAADDATFEVNGSQPTTSYDQTVAKGGTCMVNCTNRNEIYAFHPGGANVLLGDCSVRMIGPGIAPLTLAALITRAGGDVVGDY